MTSRKIAAGLLGLTAVLIVLQGVWAGIFLAADPRPDGWVKVHDLGAWATLLCSVVAAGWITLRLRADRIGWAGAVLLVLLIGGEAHLGGMITDSGDDSLAAVHVPLALALMALATWLPFRFARHAAPATGISETRAEAAQGEHAISHPPA